MLYSRASERLQPKDSYGDENLLSARSSLRAKVSTSRLNRDRGEQPRIKEFLALRADRVKIDTEDKIVGFNGNKSAVTTQKSKPFLIAIESIRDLSLADTVFKHDIQEPGVSYAVEYHCTLFSAQQQGYTGFYGRTYISRPKPLDNNAVAKEDFIFLHSTFFEKTSRLIVEVVVIQTKTVGKKTKKSKASGGFAELQIFDVGKQGKS